MSKQEDDLRAVAEQLLRNADIPEGLAEGMASVHEIFLSLRRGGFTEFQALWLIGYVLGGGHRPPEES